jgi:hypothetical protein
MTPGEWRHDIQHNDTQHINTQHKGYIMTLVSDLVTPSNCYAKGSFATGRYAECH